MIHEWGMGEKLYYEPEQRDAEQEINRLLDTADRQALETIRANKQATEKLAQALLARETLTRDEVLQLLNTSGETVAASHDELCLAEAGALGGVLGFLFRTGTWNPDSLQRSTRTRRSSGCRLLFRRAWGVAHLRTRSGDDARGQDRKLVAARLAAVAKKRHKPRP